MVLMINNAKKFTTEIILFYFFDRKLQWLILDLQKGRPSYKRSFFFVYFYGSFFVLLDPNPGSGSTDLIESGSNPDPDLKHWWLLIGNAFFYGESLHIIGFGVVRSRVLRYRYSSDRNGNNLVTYLWPQARKSYLAFISPILSSLYFTATLGFYDWSHKCYRSFGMRSWHSKLLFRGFLSTYGVWKPEKTQ